MLFTSTRGKSEVSASEAIARGIAPDGGLYVPVSLPHFTDAELAALVTADYRQRAFAVLSKFLTDYPAEELKAGIRGAYCGTFDNDQPAPLVEAAPGMHLLELWHGPTCAFKDLALQLLPYLLSGATSRVSPGRTAVILVATSGDTGKAALEGFADVEGTKILVFYPRDGVSAMQKLQMTTQSGKNVAVCAIAGNFDDAQTGVKKIFADAEMKALLAKRNMEFSSANSINFGRLAPQVVYYVSAWCDLVASGKLKAGEKFNVTVPTGNFGNILAAVYAKAMGIPIAKFICASNRNKVLTDFINTGCYDRNREFFTTTSPSMDILISSNLERLLYMLHGEDPAAVSTLMKQLGAAGKYRIGDAVLAKLQQEFYGGFCDDDHAAETIGKLFAGHHYLCDTHTAVAVNVSEAYRKASGDQRPMVIASTASPFKFAPAVLSAIGGKVPENGFDALEELSRLSQMAVPAPLATLKSKTVLHPGCIEKTEMADFIAKAL